MRKVDLNVDDLEVESFEVLDADRHGGGTVQAHGSGLGCGGLYPPDPSYSADGECVCPDMFSPA